jgi:hypothetical protein
MTITSSGTFKLEGQSLRVIDRNVTDSAIIFCALQSVASSGNGSWCGHHGVTGRIEGESFDFAAARPGCGALYAYLIFQPPAPRP